MKRCFILESDDGFLDKADETISGKCFPLVSVHHFPMQNFPKIFANKSSLEISPVISPK